MAPSSHDQRGLPVTRSTARTIRGTVQGVPISSRRCVKGRRPASCEAHDVGGASAVTTNDRRPAETASPRERISWRELLVRALPGCRVETIERLIQTVRTRSVAPGEYIYRQGEPVPLTLILEGYGAARRTTVNGKELVSGVAPSGVLFGWSGLAAVPSSVELVALTECEIGQWRGSEIRTLTSADPALALAAIDGLVDAPSGRADRRLPPPGRAAPRPSDPGAASRPFLRRAPRSDQGTPFRTGGDEPRDDWARLAPAGARRDSRAHRPYRPEAPPPRSIGRRSP
jgi:hypothetical protein